jgi:ferredoxin
MSADTDEVHGGAFEVVLAKSGRSLTVEPGKSILQVLQEAGIETPFSCGEGVCGTCLTQVREGVPDHWDMYLTPEEQEKGDCLMICISRSKSKRLVLEV